MPIKNWDPDRPSRSKDEEPANCSLTVGASRIIGMSRRTGPPWRPGSVSPAATERVGWLCTHGLIHRGWFCCPVLKVGSGTPPKKSASGVKGCHTVCELAIGRCPLTAVPVSYAFAVGALVVSVDEDLWFIAATLRAAGTISFRRSALRASCFLVRHNCNAPTQSLAGLPCRILK